MIPFRDDNPSQSFPFVTITLIVINVLVFFYQLYLQSTGQLDAFIAQAALTPYLVIAQPGLATWGDVFTSMFMHGGWLHLGGNMLYLWIFGDNIEDTLGHGLYLIFYLACGIAADAAHILSDASSTVPTLGASGAIAGVLGAYLLLYPQARIQTLLFLFRFIRVVSLSALWVLGFWFVLQLFTGVLSLGGEGGGVAYFAHVGGFVAGVALMFIYAQIRGIPVFQGGFGRRGV
jgi:membrane associated rhomboid family serine protease